MVSYSSIRRIELARCRARRHVDDVPKWIDKLSGKVAYAVMSFGGFLGIGEDYYPLPWPLLTYNPRLEGYEVNVGEQQLKGAPKYSKHESWDWSDRARDKQVDDYYGVGAYLA